MKHDVVAPSVGESITEVSILKWAKQNGDAVEVGEMLLEIESDKATVEIVAEAKGALNIIKNEGDRVQVGEKIAEIDDSAAGKATAQAKAAPSPKPAAAPTAAGPPAPTLSAAAPSVTSPHMSPSVRQIVREENLDVRQIPGTGPNGRVTRGDVVNFSTTPGAPTAPSRTPVSNGAAPQLGERRVPMSRLRAKIAERLVQVQHTAAILTTFNEVDMSAVMAFRNQHKASFQERFGVKLSFMSFFTRAAVEALKLIPEINASIDGNDIIYHDYQNVGVAVGTERGLVVPVLPHTEKMGFVEIEKQIAALAKKARDGKLSIADMSGGTFTISNGGTYGSMMSTPILNPPQSGILGMHNIVERPVAVEGQVAIRPIMFVALSYDHRIVDGKGAVTFLVKLKEFIENPQSLNPDFL